MIKDRVLSGFSVERSNLTLGVAGRTTPLTGLDLDHRPTFWESRQEARRWAAEIVASRLACAAAMPDGEEVLALIGGAPRGR